MLGSVDFHFSVDLQALAEAHKEHVSLSSDRNAQQLHYRFKDDPQVENKSITATIFYTGRVRLFATITRFWMSYFLALALLPTHFR